MESNSSDGESEDMRESDMEKHEADDRKGKHYDKLFGSGEEKDERRYTGSPLRKKKSKEAEDLIGLKMDTYDSRFQRVGSWPGRGLQSEVSAMLAHCERTYTEIQDQCQLMHKQLEERLSAASLHLEANLRNQLSQTVREVVAEVVSEADRGRRESEAQVRIAIDTLLGNCLSAKESLVHLHDLCQDHFHLTDPPFKNKASFRRRVKAFFKRKL